MSRGRLYITLAALQCMGFKALNSFLFVQHHQIGNAYVTEGKITLKYRSKSEFLGKKRLRWSDLACLAFDHASLPFSDYESTKLLGSAPNHIIKYLREEDISYNNHFRGITPEVSYLYLLLIVWHKHPLTLVCSRNQTI